MVIKKFNELNESLKNIGNLKNCIQVFNWIDINPQNELRDLIIEYYEEDLNGSDTYVRYYPNDDSYVGEELNKLINDYLIKDGYFIDFDDEYFYILIRIDW